MGDAREARLLSACAEYDFFGDPVRGPALEPLAKQGGLTITFLGEHDLVGLETVPPHQYQRTANPNRASFPFARASPRGPPAPR